MDHHSFGAGEQRPGSRRRRTPAEHLDSNPVRAGRPQPLFRPGWKAHVAQPGDRRIPARRQLDVVHHHAGGDVRQRQRPFF